MYMPILLRWGGLEIRIYDVRTYIFKVYEVSGDDIC